MDHIEKIIYINLEDRVDRKDLLLKELSVIPDIDNKLIRFNAIKDKKHGAIGCSKSHIKCLEMAIENNWKNVLIIEDDIILYNYKNSINLLNELILKPYDVILLGGTFINFDTNTYKLYSGKAASSYLVSSHYYNILLENFKEGLHKLERTMILESYCIDVYWNELQRKNNWYIVNPALMIQRDSYSDIEKQNVNYSNYYNII
jgi:glycosyl transferase family 25